MNIRETFLKKWMLLFSRIENQDGTWEGYARANEASNKHERDNALLSIADARYNESKKQRFEDLFKMEFTTILAGKDVLEIGSNHGGASLYYYKHYNLNWITGIDTTEEQAEIAEQFFNKNGISEGFTFQKGFAESLPFSNDSFDAILSYDVFEHVTNVRKALEECYRVLKPGGRAYTAFPSYYQPVAHHLSVVTSAPFIHWFYSGKTLMKVYYDILDEYPLYRDRKGQQRRELKCWEKLYIINGTTLSSFKKLLKYQNWKRSEHRALAFGSFGKSRNKYKIVK